MTNVDDSADGAYLEWLYSQVAVVVNRNPARSYWRLLTQMYSKPYTWFIPNDDNRVMDGIELRTAFLDATGFNLNDPRGAWMTIDCSMLEMFIALAQRASYDSGRTPSEWFWRLMHNLELERYTDDLYEISIAEEVDETLDRINNRTYDWNGDGGLFPLHEAKDDQRGIELWYQLQAYLTEGYYLTDVPDY